MKPTYVRGSQARIERDAIWRERYQSTRPTGTSGGVVWDEQPFLLELEKARHPQPEVEDDRSWFGKSGFYKLPQALQDELEDKAYWIAKDRTEEDMGRYYDRTQKFYTSYEKEASMRDYFYDIIYDPSMDYKDYLRQHI